MREFSTDYGLVTVWENDSVIVRAMETGKLFEQQEVERYFSEHVKVAKTILDIGGHVGSHTVMYHKLNPCATIHVFEPQRRMFELLEMNIAKNCDPKRVFAHWCAMGHCARDARMSNTVADGPSPGLPIQYGSREGHNLGGLALGKDGEAVDMRTVDSLALTGCEFIKIDVEGFEPLVVMGAMETINRFHPVVCFECNEKTITDDMCEFFGFKMKEIKTTTELLEEFGYEVRPIAPGSENYIALWKPTAKATPSSNSSVS